MPIGEGVFILQHFFHKTRDIPPVRTFISAIRNTIYARKKNTDYSQGQTCRFLECFAE
jgi:hypothetical protein